MHTCSKTVIWKKNKGETLSQLLLSQDLKQERDFPQS